LAAKAADYEIDAPRKRNELGQALPFRESVVAPDFMADIRRAQAGDVVTARFFKDTTFDLHVTGRWQDDNGLRVAARLPGEDSAATFFMSWSGASARGLLLLPSKNLAYEIVLAPSGAFVVREWLHGDVMCSAPLAGGGAGVGMPRPEAVTPPATSPPRISPAAVPLLNSRPGAPGVIYLDFDGEIVSGTAWAGGATINAPAARMTAAQITETWERVSRDFAPYNVNVTTLRSVYDAAPANRRTHCVITALDTAAPGAGGVAYLDSFAGSSAAFKVCWSFIDDNARNCAVVISHEVGHTLNLNHDGRVASGTQAREE